MRPENFLLKKAIFTTREFAQATQTRVDASSRKLKSYESAGVITAITRGVWIQTQNPNFSRYGLVPYLLGNEQGYVSFLSALNRHGVITQIPQRIFVATTGHTRSFRSELAEFDFIQMKPQYMQYGVEWFSGGVSYALATAEKALLDCLYISTRRGNKFQFFPEIDREAIQNKKLKELLKAHQYPEKIEVAIRERLTELKFKV